MRAKYQTPIWWANQLDAYNGCEYKYSATQKHKLFLWKILDYWLTWRIFVDVSYVPWLKIDKSDTHVGLCCENDWKYAKPI